MRTSSPNWSPKEIATAAEMWQRLADDTYGEDVPPSVERRVLDSIAVRLNHPIASIQSRYRDHGPSFSAGGAARRNLSPLAIAQRDARRRALEQSSLTAQIFGDPPPGYSALDKRKPPCGAGTGLGTSTGRR
jgi:hypothetical protein